MLRTAWFLARKDVEYMLRSKETIFWTFFMPVLFFFLIGSITGGFSSSLGPSSGDPILVETGADPGYLLHAAELTVQHPRTAREVRIRCAPPPYRSESVTSTRVRSTVNPGSAGGRARGNRRWRRCARRAGRCLRSCAV